MTDTVAPDADPAVPAERPVMAFFCVVLGAVAMGSRVSVGTNLASGFLFRFEAEGNSLAQFVVMSLAGFVATALALAVFYTQLPDAWLASRVARGGAVFLAFLGLTLELPLLLYGLAIRGVPRQVAV